MQEFLWKQNVFGTTVHSDRNSDCKPARRHGIQKMGRKEKHFLSAHRIPVLCESLHASKKLVINNWELC